MVKSSSLSSEGDTPTVHPEFQQWHDGGGSFHKFACIDPTVFIEFGAVVHSKSVVGESCHRTSLLGSQPKLVGEIQLRDHATIGNLVQIGHNVIVAKNCLLCGQVGIAGSVTIGDYITMGGRVAVRDHLWLAATSYVTKDITGPEDYGGFPPVHLHEWRRQVANHRRT